MLTPAMKGQVTKAFKPEPVDKPKGFKLQLATHVLRRYMPREQAKHAARKLLSK